MDLLKISLTFFAALCCIYAADIPSYIPRTGKCSSENAAGCIKKKLEVYRSYLAKGVPELNVITVEPVKIRHVRMSQGSGAVQVDANFTNLVVHGISNYTVKNVEFDTKTWKKFRLEIEAPKLLIDCDYNMFGKVLLLPIQGQGTAHGEATKLVLDYTCDMKLVRRNGNLHVKLLNPKYDYDLGGLTLHFNNLFNGKRLLGETMNRFLNENWREVFLDVRNSLVGDIDDNFRKNWQIIFDLFPLAEMFEINEEQINKEFANEIISE